jgi:hypothetical protein
VAGHRHDVVEYLLVDLMKSWSTAKTVVESFFPSLIVQDGYIVHQDFIHFYTPWIHLVMYRLRGSIAAVFEIPSSGSVVFRVKRQSSGEEYAKAVDFARITVEEVDEAFRYSESLVEKNSKAPIKAAEAMFFYHYAHLQRSQKVAEPTFDEWMALAIERFQRIPPDLRSHRDVPRAGKWIEPFMAKNG